MKIAHIWWDYSPNLFDKSHPLCISHKVPSEVVCQAFIDNGALQLPNTHFVRKRSPNETNTFSIIRRLVNRLRRPVDNIRFAHLVKSRLRDFAPDILHIHFGTTAATLYKSGILPDLPMVVSFYGVDISQSLRSPEVVKAYQYIFKKKCILHALCDDVKKRLVDLGCPAEKVRVANLPADLSNIPNIGVQATGHTRFVIAARFVEKKGHEVLLRALSNLLQKGHPVSLTCFGYGPSEWLERRVEELGLSQHVQIINNQQSGDFISEYMHILQQHDVVVAPSIIASTGDDEAGPQMSFVIAQAAGKPGIVTDFPGHERSVTDGEQGLVVPMGDIMALEDAMAKMINNLPLWQKFGSASRHLVLNEFTEETYWEFLRGSYRDLQTK